MNETQTDGLRGRNGRARRRKERFLEHLAKSGNVSDSGRVAGVQRSTLYHWKETDAAFASQWEDALEDAADVLEAEARRRALEGYDEPITYAGKVVCDRSGRRPPEADWHRAAEADQNRKARRVAPELWRKP